MCAITASFRTSKLRSLYTQNSYRGELSYSLCTFLSNEYSTRIGLLIQDSGKMPDELIDSINAAGHYMVAHSQAPTTNATNIHPAVYDDALLWHNGIIKQKNISEGTWDTQWMLSRIVDYGWSSLSRIDGTFACIMYWNKSLYVFRNEISPLFIDKELNISSTKFEDSEPIKPNTVFRIDLYTKQLYNEASFTTFENPYYFPQEV